MNARLTLCLFWWANWKACRSRRRRSSNLKVVCRRWAAALAPGPRCASLSIRQIAWALTTATLVARLVSPITLPRRPSASPSQPLARPILAHLASAEHLRWKSWYNLSASPSRPSLMLNVNNVCQRWENVDLPPHYQDCSGPSVKRSCSSGHKDC